MLVVFLVFTLTLAVVGAILSPAQNNTLPNTVGQPQLVAQLGHPRIAGRVVLSPDSKFLLSTGRDWSKEAILWDVATGLELYRLKGHKGFFLAAAFSHNGRFMVTGSSEGSVTVTGSKDNVPGLAEKIVEALKAAIARIP